MSFIKKKLPALPILPTPESYSPMQFIYHLQALAYNKWYGSPTIDVQFDSSAVRVAVACPHGLAVEQMVSMSALEGHDANGLAEVVFKQLQDICENQHAKIPPPGQYVYSLGSTEPIAYVAKNGPVYKMEDFKQMYANGYADIQGYLNTELLQGYSTILSSGFGASYGSPNSGSILTTLIAICPGLANIKRPCPDCKNVPGYDDRPTELCYLIQHLNDSHMWSRTKIAEWLDIIALDDPNVDLTIKPKEKNEQPSIGPSSEEVATIYGIYDELTVDNGATAELIKGILGGGS